MIDWSIECNGCNKITESTIITCETTNYNIISSYFSEESNRPIPQLAQSYIPTLFSMYQYVCIYVCMYVCVCLCVMLVLFYRTTPRFCVERWYLYVNVCCNVPLHPEHEYWYLDKRMIALECMNALYWIKSKRLDWLTDWLNWTELNSW